MEKPAGSIARNGYRTFVIDRKHYLAHRLAWLYHYGEWPNGDIDHINRNKDDNRITNLRVVDKTINQANSGVQINNTSGYRGVSKARGRNKWRVTITHKGKDINLGSFSSLEEAKEVYNYEFWKIYGFDP